MKIVYTIVLVLLTLALLALLFVLFMFVASGHNVPAKTYTIYWGLVSIDVLLMFIVIAVCRRL